VRCACDAVFELTGNQADEYSREHLEEVKVDNVNWTVEYRCPTTGAAWILDWPQSGLQGGGPPRLRQFDASGHPVSQPSVDPYR